MTIVDSNIGANSTLVVKKCPGTCGTTGAEVSFCPGFNSYQFITISYSKLVKIATTDAFLPDTFAAGAPCRTPLGEAYNALQTLSWLWWGTPLNTSTVLMPSAFQFMASLAFRLGAPTALSMYSK